MFFAFKLWSRNWLRGRVFEIENKLKFTAGRIYDDLKLSNKGKMKKGKAEFHHRNAGDSSGK